MTGWRAYKLPSKNTMATSILSLNLTCSFHTLLCGRMRRMRSVKISTTEVPIKKFCVWMHFASFIREKVQKA